MDKAPKVIIISISSDIGTALGGRWAARGWEVVGTYRKDSPGVEQLTHEGMKLVYCDLSDHQSILAASVELLGFCPRWDVLVLCPGMLDPIGPFGDCDFDEWEKSIQVNFTAQMRLIHELLPSRRVGSKQGPCVLLFAGGGTNSAPVNFSAYTVSKIALIKMCELLDAEIPDTRFVIVGPGWVKNKIHDATLKAGTRAGANYQRTVAKLANAECTPMESVLNCCDWVIAAPREVVSGRNFSVVFDRWGDEELEKLLCREPDMYKLKRCGNDRLIRKKFSQRSNSGRGKRI